LNGCGTDPKPLFGDSGGRLLLSRARSTAILAPRPERICVEHTHDCQCLAVDGRSEGAASEPRPQRSAINHHKLMRQLLVLALIAWACSIATGQAQQSPTVKEINVNGTTLVYQEQGHGASVVFVHGSPGDHRSWDGQREGIARTHRFIARPSYFGTAPWTARGFRWGPMLTTRSPNPRA
jgi:hypothetical protein